MGHTQRAEGETEASGIGAEGKHWRLPDGTTKTVMAGMAEGDDDSTEGDGREMHIARGNWQAWVVWSVEVSRDENWDGDGYVTVTELNVRLTIPHAFFLLA